MDKIIYEVNNVGYSYKHFSLQDINFNLVDGEVCAVLGANGSGKTTLIKSLVNILKGSGTVKYNGSTDYLDVLAYVPDSFPFESLNQNNLIYFLEMNYESFNKDKFNQLLESFGLANKKNYKKLSNGEKQRLMFATVLARQSEVFILDEPSDGIDPFFRETMIDLLFDEVIDSNGITILSTHNIQPYETMVDRIIYLSRGKLVVNQTKDFILEQGESILKELKFDEALVEQFMHQRNLTSFMEVMQIGGF